MYLTTNLNKTGDLLSTVYHQLDSYRSQLDGSEFPGPSASAPPDGGVSQPSYLLLYSAVESLAQQLSSTASSTYAHLVANHSHYAGLTSTLAPPPLADELGPYIASSPAVTSSSSSVWSGLMDSLPMPTDEVSLNSELGLGPVRDPLWTAIPMTVLYILILVTGVIGNLITCVVIVRNRYMHTATNYYLHSLAISDLLLLILGLPSEIYQIWQRYPYAFGETFCILRGFSSEASTNSSVLTISAFTVERYVAICHPLRAHTMSKLSRAIRLIIIIWALGFLCAAPIAYQFGIVFDYVHDEVKIPQSATCNIKRQIPYLEAHIFALQSLLFFVVPVSLISVLYVLIGLKLRQSSQSAKSDLNRMRRKVVKHRHNSESSSSKDSSGAGGGTTYFSASIESIEVNNNSGNSNAAISSSHTHKQLKEMASCASINSAGSLAHYATAANGTCASYIDHRHRSRLSKFTSSTSSASSASGGSSLSQRRAVIKMLTAVVVAFFVCFAPFHAQRLMAIYVKNPSHYETFAFNMLTYISGVTYYLSATINPILYSIMSVRFRQAFHDTFVRTFCPSKSAIFQCTRQRTMSQMYNSMYYRASHPHIHQHFNPHQGPPNSTPSPLAVHSSKAAPITAAAVIAAPLTIVTHSIIKKSGSGSGHGNRAGSPITGNGIPKNLVFNSRISMIEEAEYERSQESSPNPGGGCHSDAESLESSSDSSQGKSSPLAHRSQQQSSSRVNSPCGGVVVTTN